MIEPPQLSTQPLHVQLIPVTIQKGAVAKMRVRDLTKTKIALDELNAVEAHAVPDAVPQIAKWCEQMKHHVKKSQRPSGRWHAHPVNSVWTRIFKFHGEN